MTKRELKLRNEERQAVKRVLRLVDRFLKRQRQDLLVTEGRGLMTWGEIRSHIRAALNTPFLQRPLK